MHTGIPLCLRETYAFTPWKIENEENREKQKGNYSLSLFVSLVIYPCFAPLSFALRHLVNDYIYCSNFSYLLRIAILRCIAFPTRILQV